MPFFNFQNVTTECITIITANNEIILRQYFLEKWVLTNIDLYSRFLTSSNIPIEVKGASLAAPNHILFSM